MLLLTIIRHQPKKRTNEIETITSNGSNTCTNTNTDNDYKDMACISLFVLLQFFPDTYPHIPIHAFKNVKQHRIILVQITIAIEDYRQGGKRKK
mmetsp:Transcript_5315/g.6501  ORF Transcript_5315/g.6501 Transcript_5315/m.6501 type:complete len:94 (+) Transcript_5315:1146-1427(+)